MVKQNNLSYSVVIPFLNEEENIPELYKRLTSVMTSIHKPYEIIFVDDGSEDGSIDLIRKIIDSDPRVLVVSLSRNYGHQVAVSAGIDHARGEAVIVMDADLQDPPEVLPSFMKKLDEGYDVVYAIRKKRKEGFLMRFLYALFYRMLQRVSNINVPLDSGDFCIMSHRVAMHLRGMKERNRFVRGVRSWVGFKQIGLEYERDKRYSGEAKYTFSKLIRLAFDGLVSFSYIPLRIASLVGFIISVINFIAIFVYMFIKLFTDLLMPRGFPTIIMIVLFLGGIQLITIGIIGEYIGRIYDEVKQRPFYIVKELLRSEKSVKTEVDTIG